MHSSVFQFSTLLLLLIIGSSGRDHAGGFAEACNICGCDDCDFADGTAIVTFTYKEKKAKMACAPLQEKADVKTQIDDEYCRTTLVEVSRITCKCYFKNGTLLEDAYAATIPPGENATKAPRDSSGGGGGDQSDDTSDINGPENEPSGNSSTSSATTTSSTKINQLLTSVLLLGFIWIYSY